MIKPVHAVIASLKEAAISTKETIYQSTPQVLFLFALIAVFTRILEFNKNGSLLLFITLVLAFCLAFLDKKLNFTKKDDLFKLGSMSQTVKLTVLTIIQLFFYVFAQVLIAKMFLASSPFIFSALIALLLVFFVQLLHNTDVNVLGKQAKA